MAIATAMPSRCSNIKRWHVEDRMLRKGPPPKSVSSRNDWFPQRALNASGYHCSMQREMMNCGTLSIPKNTKLSSLSTGQFVRRDVQSCISDDPGYWLPRWRNMLHLLVSDDCGCGLQRTSAYLSTRGCRLGHWPDS